LSRVFVATGLLLHDVEQVGELFFFRLGGGGDAGAKKEREQNRCHPEPRSLP
jgi:hypothetical protein